MFGAKDLVYSVILAGAMMYWFHYRPLLEVQAIVKEDALAGFQQVYQGHRFLDGNVVAAQGARGAQTDIHMATLQRRRFNIDASHLTWNSRGAEFYVNHVVRVVGRDSAGFEVGRKAHIKLKRHSGQWVYEFFQAHGSEPVSLGSGNPWIQALRKGLRGSR